MQSNENTRRKDGFDLQGKDGWINETIEKIRENMAWVSDKNKDIIPYTCGPDGSYLDMSKKDLNDPNEGINWWTNGFWGGLLWLLYEDTKEDKYRKYAIVSEKKLEECFVEYAGLHHDVGFMYLLTAVANYKITGNPHSREVGLHAANLLAGRFNIKGHFIRAWNSWDQNPHTGWAIIDCMMNLALLYWAYEEDKDPRYLHIAKAHADMVREHFIREDGSSEHIVEFDPVSGKQVTSYGGQGYERGSAWSRGQAWAVYGFTISYLHTKEERYLETAKKAADYCLSQIPESGIIPIDFRQPEEPALEDSCGGAILASGLLELERQMPAEEGSAYRQGALKILKTLALERSDFSRDCDAILKNCSASYHEKNHHIAMVYADYFFTEALFKLAGRGRFLW